MRIKGQMKTTFIDCHVIWNCVLRKCNYNNIYEIIFKKYYRENTMIKINPLFTSIHILYLQCPKNILMKHQLYNFVYRRNCD